MLRGSWVELRPTEIGDADELFTALDFPEVWRYIPASRPTSADDWVTIIQATKEMSAWFRWTVRLIQDVNGISAGTIVGTTSYLDSSANDARTEIGATTYAPSVWGSKVNPDAKHLLLDFAFESLGMGRVQLKTDVRNTRSQRAIDRLGATYEGVLRRYQRRGDDTIRDTVMFSITIEEWPSVKQTLLARIAQDEK
jgi:RimJ/RimL family protein N-acetyltransferase